MHDLIAFELAKMTKAQGQDIFIVTDNRCIKYLFKA